MGRCVDVLCTACLSPGFFTSLHPSRSLSTAQRTTSPSVLLPTSDTTDFGSPSLLALSSPPASGAATPLSPATAIIGKPKRIPEGEQTVHNMYPQRVVLTSALSLASHRLSLARIHRLTCRHPSHPRPLYPCLPLISPAYPGQVGIHPVPLTWGANTPAARGPVVASRHQDSLRIRNAIG